MNKHILEGLALSGFLFWGMSHLALALLEKSIPAAIVYVLITFFGLAGIIAFLLE